MAELTFTVTKGNGSTVRYGPYGKTGLIPFSVQGNIISFFGSSGNLLDSIGFYSYSNLSRSELFGGTYNESHFDSNHNSPQSAVTEPALKISKLLICSGNQVDRIQAEYVTYSGKFILSPTFGGTGGSLHVIEATPSCFLVSHFFALKKA